MLKIIMVSILMLSSIFWGLFPAAKESPHNLISNYLGYTEEVHYSIYILTGTIFYLSSAFLSQQNNIQHMWK